MQLFDMNNYAKLKFYRPIIVTPELVVRFESKVVRDDCMPDGCHIWTGVKNPKGYGSINFKGKNLRAHRISYTIYNGEIPYGLLVCHRCDNPPCVNPAHLFVGTASDNEQDKLSKGRNYQKNKTHCPQGHEYAGDNLHIRKSDGGRHCNTCRLNYQRKGRSLKAPKTHCKYGHELTADNIYTRPSNAYRECVTCRYLHRLKVAQQ